MRMAGLGWLDNPNIPGSEPMAYDNAEQLEAFRAETRKWLEENCPPSMRTPMPDDEVVWPQRRSELRHLDAGPGAAGVRQRGAEAAPAARSRAARSAGARATASRAPGSDLAALQTAARTSGDHFLINGQKIWTSYADKADWIFCLVRTDTEAKHTGISFVLIDMTSPGVSTRPDQADQRHSARSARPSSTDVKVPKENLVGKLNGGWHAPVAAFEGQLDRGRHQRDQPQRHRETRARPEGSSVAGQTFRPLTEFVPGN
jgi:hypothetical protein